MPPIYLDYQASTPLLPAVREYMIAALSEFTGNPHSETHLHGREASLIVEKARDQISSLIGAEAENVVFTSGATESNNFLIRQGAKLNGDRRTILVSSIEHKCVLESAFELSQVGYTVILIKTDQNGYIDREHYENSLSDDVALVSIMSANNEIGTIFDLPPLIKLAHNAGALFHTDAAQQLSHSDLDVNTVGADFVSFSSHKMYGPKGIGAAYIAPHIFEEIEPFITGGGQQDGKRSGTLSPLLCGGFGEAAHQYLTNETEMRSQTKHYRDRFYSKLKAELVEGINLVGPNLDSRHIGNLNIEFTAPSSTLLGRLSPKVSASNGSACTSGQIGVSHVFKALGLTAAQAERCVRFSFGVGLTDEDIDKAICDLISVLNT